MTKRNLLEMSGVGISLQSGSGYVDVVKDVHLNVAKGELIGIAGESGSGKSMTGRALLNILPPGARVSGRIEFEGRDMTTLTTQQWRQVRGREIAMVFQDPYASLHPMLPIKTQLTEHLRAGLGLSRREAYERAIELLQEVRIPDPESALRSYPHQFSGGMRQRIAIAVALAPRPKLLIADEPTTALDVTVQAGILRLMGRLSRELDLSVLFVSHDLGVLSALTDRVYVFYAGRVIETARTKDLMSRPIHPYTQALLRARPDGGGGGRGVLTAIPGHPATAASSPTGCPFHPRCSISRPECAAELPVGVDIAEAHGEDAEHIVRCLVNAPARHGDERVFNNAAD